MAEHVERSGGRDTSGLAGLSERSLGVRPPPSFSVRTGKQQAVARLSRSKSTKKDHPIIGQKDVTHFPARGGSDGDRAGFAIEIVRAKRGELAVTASGEQRSLDHLAQARRRSIDQSARLVMREIAHSRRIGFPE